MMRLLLAAIACTVLAAAPSALAQQNCTITTTASIGPNGETITRREGCGAVEITTTGGASNQTHSNQAPPQTGGPHTSAPPPQAPPPNVNTSAPSMPSMPSMPVPPPMPSMAPPPMPSVGGPSNFESSDMGKPPPGDMNMMPQGPLARIVLYDRARQQGHRIGITLDTPDLVRRHFDNQAASLRVQGGLWEVCDQANYQGRCERVSGDVDLASLRLDHAISSVRLITPP